MNYIGLCFINPFICNSSSLIASLNIPSKSCLELPLFVVRPDGFIYVHTWRSRWTSLAGVGPSRDADEQITGGNISYQT